MILINFKKFFLLFKELEIHQTVSEEFRKQVLHLLPWTLMCYVKSTTDLVWLINYSGLCWRRAFPAGCSGSRRVWPASRRIRARSCGACVLDKSSLEGAVASLSEETGSKIAGAMNATNINLADLT